MKLRLERVGHRFACISLQEIQRMNRDELVIHLESRGTACYDDESTELLRQCAIEDWEGELLDKFM